MNSILVKTLVDRRWFMIGWTLGFMAFAALMVTFYPAMHMDGALDALVANMPAAFQGLVGDLSDLSEFSTYLASQLFDIRLPLIAGIMAIVLGQGLSTAEEERGELRTLLSLPISRTRIVLEKWLALVIITGVTVGGLLLGVVATMPFVENATIAVDELLRLLLMTWLLMLVYGTIAFGVGVTTGNKGLATGVSVLVIIGSFILSTFGQAVDWLSDYEWLSLIYYFPAVEVVTDGIEWVNLMVLGSVSLLALLVSVAVFRLRDVR